MNARPTMLIFAVLNMIPEDHGALPGERERAPGGTGPNRSQPVPAGPSRAEPGHE